MFSRIYKILFALILVVGLVSCDQEKSEQSQKSTFSSEEEVLLGKHNSLDYYLRSVRVVGNKNYGDSIVIYRNKNTSKKIVFKTTPTGDAYIDNDSIKFVELSNDGLTAIVYVVEVEGGGENSSDLNVIAQHNNNYFNLQIKSGYTYFIKDLNRDGVMEIIHRYNEPYYSQPVGDIPGLYWEDVYILKDEKLVKITNFKGFGAYISERKAHYEKILAMFPSMNEFYGKKEYGSLVREYLERVNK